MAKLSWTNELETGSRFIDDDHQKLIKMINSLIDAMVKDYPIDIVRNISDNLIAYTGEHFAREEVEMDRIKYHGALTHKAAHRKLITHILKFKKKLDTGDALNAVAISGFLSDWLRNHILQVDVKLALALRR